MSLACQCKGQSSANVVRVIRRRGSLERSFTSLLTRQRLNHGCVRYAGGPFCAEEGARSCRASRVTFYADLFSLN